MPSAQSRTIFGVGAIVLFVCQAITLIGSRNLTNLMAKETAESTEKPVGEYSIAVVELFTSEGCSSCPPADDNLRRIANATFKSNQKTIPLSFHVDYWNRLGWKDPFSQAAFSERQRDYAATLNSDNVYTPQMIVNGTTEFVGSNRRLTDNALREALKYPAKHSVTLSTKGVADNVRSTFRYHIIGLDAREDGASDYELNIAVATDLETVSVARGENGGHKLSHVWVVKSLQTLPLNSSNGIFSIDPTTVKEKHSRVVAYVQSKSTREITGAAALDL